MYNLKVSIAASRKAEVEIVPMEVGLAYRIAIHSDKFAIEDGKLVAHDYEPGDLQRVINEYCNPEVIHVEEVQLNK